MNEVPLAEARKDFQRLHKMFLSLERINDALEAVRLEEESANEARARAKKEQADAEAALRKIQQQLVQAKEARATALEEAEQAKAGTQQTLAAARREADTIIQKATDDSANMLELSKEQVSKERTAAERTLSNLQEGIQQARRDLDQLAVELEKEQALVAEAQAQREALLQRLSA